MSTSGWFVMLVSISCACTLFGWCLYRVMTTHKRGDLHTIHETTPDIEPAKGSKRSQSN